MEIYFCIFFMHYIEIVPRSSFVFFALNQTYPTIQPDFSLWIFNIHIVVVSLFRNLKDLEFMVDVFISFRVVFFGYPGPVYHWRSVDAVVLLIWDFGVNAEFFAVDVVPQSRRGALFGHLGVFLEGNLRVGHILGWILGFQMGVIGLIHKNTGFVFFRMRLGVISIVIMNPQRFCWLIFPEFS